MFTPKDIYEIIKQFIACQEYNICFLHKPCKTEAKCHPTQKTPVIDFDLVKTEWNKKNKKESDASTDALTCSKSENKLCFVEIKGWLEFLKNQKTLKKLSSGEIKELSKEERKSIKNKIYKQTSKYNFQKKLLDSISICEDITGVRDLCKVIEIKFILVTDIDPQKDPLNVFTQQLYMLANTSSDWETVCIDVLGRHLKSSIKGISTDFIYCKEFDNYISHI